MTNMVAVTRLIINSSDSLKAHTVFQSLNHNHNVNESVNTSTYWKHELRAHLNINKKSDCKLTETHCCRYASASNLGSSSGSNSVSAVKDTYAPEHRMHAIPLLRLFTLQICGDESKQRVPMSLSPNSSLVPCLPLVPLTHITKKPTDHPCYQRRQCAPSKTWDPLFSTCKRFYKDDQNTLGKTNQSHVPAVCEYGCIKRTGAHSSVARTGALKKTTFLHMCHIEYCSLNSF